MEGIAVREINEHRKIRNPESFGSGFMGCKGTEMISPTPTRVANIDVFRV